MSALPESTPSYMASTRSIINLLARSSDHSPSMAQLRRQIKSQSIRSATAPSKNRHQSSVRHMQLQLPRQQQQIGQNMHTADIN